MMNTKSKSKGLRRNRAIAATFLSVCFAFSAHAGELAVVGTGDGMFILSALAGSFNAKNPETTVTIPPSIGSGGAIAAVGTGQNSLGRVARPLTDAEKAQGLAYVAIMRVPAAFVAHPSAGVAALTDAQLKSIYEGSVSNWKEVGGADIRIRVVRREDSDSTLTVLRQTMPGWANIAITSRSKTATTTQDMLESVRSTEGAIGFAPFDPSSAKGLTVFAVNGSAPSDPIYPSATQIALIYKDPSLTAEGRKFVEFSRSPDAQALIKTLGAIPN